jgi:hypothetical protein
MELEHIESRLDEIKRFYGECKRETEWTLQNLQDHLYYQVNQLMENLKYFTHEDTLGFDTFGRSVEDELHEAQYVLRNMDVSTL